jgi:type I restriction enzyme, S subunit
MRGGWKKRKLGAVCGFIRGPFGGSLKKSFFKSEGYAVYEQQHAINDQFESVRYFIDEPKFREMRRFEVFHGDLIMSCSGTMGKVAIVPENIKRGIINQALLKLTPSNDLDVVFLKLWMESPNFQDQLRARTKGVAIKNVASVKILKEIEVELPPLAEQKRIVAILDEAFEGISAAVGNAEKNLANARELFESYLNSVFSDKGDGWVEKPIAQIATKIGSGATPRGGQESYKAEGIPLIRSLNVHDRKFKYDDLAFLHDEQAEKLDNVIVQKGDVLLNITGASVARCCQVPDDVLPARVNQHVSIIRPIQSIVSPRFLEYSLTARSNKDRLLGVGEKGGSTRQAITKAEIQEFQLAYPPFNTQAAATSRLDGLSIETSRLENIYQQKLESLAELKQAILQKAFAGELAAHPKQVLQEAVA